MHDYGEVVQNLRDFMARTGKKQSEIYRAIGVSSAALSQFMSNQYQGDNNGMADKIRKYLIQQDARALNPDLPPFAMTAAAKEVFFTANYAQNNNAISLVYGRAGVGKTMAIKEYIKQNVGVVYVAMRECDNNVSAACQRILSTLGKSVKGRNSALLDGIIDVLGNTGRLIIIDESQHLYVKAINNLRSLNDEGNIPILFAGSPEVYENIHAEKYLDQVFSRICPKREIKDKPHINDIQLIFENYNLSDKCIEALYSTACQKGCLRNMMMIYQMAAFNAASMNEPLNEKHIITGQRHADSRQR